MKSKLKTMTCAVLVLAVLLISASIFQRDEKVGASSVNSTVSADKIITANGEGKIVATPDVAKVNIGVISEGKDLSTVKKDNTTKMTKILKGLKDLGIKDKDIKTIDYSVNPTYNYNEKTGASTISGYSISNTVEVTVSDIDKTENLLDKVVDCGSNNVNGITFGVKDEATLYNQALELAVKDAKAKAASMGKGLGISNMSASKITEVSSPSYTFETGRELMNTADKAAISTGTLEITANVSVDFSFK